MDKDTLDKDVILAHWRSRGFNGFLWVDTPGQAHKNYVHETDELFLLIDGQVELEIQGQKYRPQPGEEVFIPARAVHTVRNIGSGPSRWLYGCRETSPEI